jgi:phosphate transport system protein
MWGKMDRKSYHESLNDLRDEVFQLGELVISQVRRALNSLSQDNHKIARSVISTDDEIDHKCLELENKCTDIFAVQEPIAGDLRFITATFKIITDLERIGDLAENLAQYGIAARHSFDPEIEIDQIGRDAVEMLTLSLDAYNTDNAEICREIVERDDHIDTLCQHASETVSRQLIEQRGVDDGAWTLEQMLDDVTRILLTIRDLERIADHAVNIAARTIEMVDNDPGLLY